MVIAKDLGSEIVIASGLDPHDRIVNNPAGNFGRWRSSPYFVPEPGGGLQGMKRRFGHSLALRAVLCAGVVALAGCDFAPRYATPEIATPEKLQG